MKIAKQSVKIAIAKESTFALLQHSQPEKQFSNSKYGGDGAWGSGKQEQ